MFGFLLYVFKESPGKPGGPQFGPPAEDDVHVSRVAEGELTRPFRPPLKARKNLSLWSSASSSILSALQGNNSALRNEKEK